MTSGDGTTMSGATSVAQARACPMCGRTVQPDALGLLECPCGWGGPGDPLEASRGLARVSTRWYRQMASARREIKMLPRYAERISGSDEDMCSARGWLLACC
jgi:hypothetical protein